jgi:transposase
MSQIKQLLRLHQQGKGIKFIARTLSISKNTVKAYLEKISLSSLDVHSLMEMEDPLLEKKFHPGNPAYTDKRFDHFKGKLDYFEKELKKTGVTKQLLWSEYKRDYPGGYSLSQFYFHLSQQLIARKPSMVLEHLAGEKLFIDFAGKKLSFIDRDTGEVIPCQVFVACLPYSDYSFVMAVKSQGLDDFLYASGVVWKSSGEYPKQL